MAKEHEIIWDKKPPKVIEPSATVSARVIVLNETAAAPLKDTESVCLGYSNDKKTVYVKAFQKDTDDELIIYTGKTGDHSFSIKCAKFIASLGLTFESRKKIKCAVTVEDNLVILSL